MLQTDSVPTVAQLLHIQLHSPISLDPPVYHLLAHAAVRAVGPTPFALRLPSLCGFLLMQLCLFIYVRRAAGDRAGLLAAAIPALTATLYYAAEARPYGLLLGFFALTLVAYQAATRRSDEAEIAPERASVSRTGPLTLLAAAIALTLNTHYFGVLLLVPIYAAELARSFARRKPDLPVILAVLAGTASLALTIPFQRAAAEFRIHYYNLANAGPRAITQAYRSLFVDYTQASLPAQHILAIGFVLLTVCFLAALALRWKSFHLPPGEAVFLLTLAALPFFGYLLAHFVTHTIEVRYVLGAIVAIAALAAVLIAPLLERDRLYAELIAAAAFTLAGTGVLLARGAARASSSAIASLGIPDEIEAMLRADPDGRIYIQEVGPFEGSRYYAPDPDVRRRITLVYSSGQEIRVDRHDTEALTAEHLAQFSDLPVVTYRQVLGQRGPTIFLVYPSNGWQWIDRALGQDGLVLTPVAPWFGGTLAVTDLPGPSGTDDSAASSQPNTQ